MLAERLEAGKGLATDGVEQAGPQLQGPAVSDPNSRVL